MYLSAGICHEKPMSWSTIISFSFLEASFAKDLHWSIDAIG